MTETARRYTADTITDDQLDALSAERDQLRTENETLRAALARCSHRERAEQAEAERDGAYRERAQLLAWLAAMHESVIASATDINEPGWQILYLYAGGWQMSWHVHPLDAAVFADVKHVPASHPRAQWDGHSTDAKYARMRQHVRVLHMNARLDAPKEN